VTPWPHRGWLRLLDVNRWRRALAAIAAATAFLPLLTGCVGSATPSAGPTTVKSAGTATTVATGSDGVASTGSALTAATTAPAGSAPVASTVDTTPVDSAGATPGGVYVVQAGDTFTAIAKLTGTTVDRILAANGWNDPTHLIYAGMKLKLPSHLKS